MNEFNKRKSQHDSSKAAVDFTQLGTKMNEMKKRMKEQTNKLCLGLKKH